MSNKTVEMETIKEGGLNEKPSFYKSLTDNPLTDIVKNNISAYRFLRLKEAKQVNVIAPTATTITIPGTGGHGGGGSTSGTLPFVDISNFQGDIDFDALAGTQIDGVLIRTSYYFSGSLQEDLRWRHNRDEARRVGLLVGYYHVMQPDFDTPNEEADYFWSLIGPDILEGECAALDWENTNSDYDATGWVYGFMLHFEDLSGGFKPFLYINQFTMNFYDWSSTISNGNPLWLAVGDGDETYRGPTPWAEIIIKQWALGVPSDIAGITTDIDKDTFFGDRDRFKGLGYYLPETDSITTIVGSLYRFTMEHRLSSIPIPFVYTPTLQQNVVTSGVSADSKNIYVDIVNLNLSAQTVNLVIYIYEFIQKS